MYLINAVFWYVKKKIPSNDNDLFPFIAARSLVRALPSVCIIFSCKLYVLKYSTTEVKCVRGVQRHSTAAALRYI